MSHFHAHLDPGWYLDKLWLLAVIFGGILMFVVALKNRRRNRKRAKADDAARKADHAARVTIKPDPRPGPWDK